MKKIVFLGNPNVGKSALINAMSKSKIKVGNWPGVTVEKIEAQFNYKGVDLQLVDLPGTYNFTNNHEEKITTEVLLSGDYDLIINVVDATNLERNLNVTLLARELEKPMIVLLNFDDDVTKSGLMIDTVKLQRYLQVPVFKTSATKGTGISNVLDYIVGNDFSNHVDYNIYYDNDIDMTVSQIFSILVEDQVEVPSYGLKFLAYRLFEKEPHYTRTINEDTLEKVNQVINNSSISLQESSSDQLHIRRYEQIKKILKSVIDKNGVSRYKLTKKIDSIVLNRWLGIPIFILFAIYFLSLVFNVANPFVDWIDGFVGDFLSYHVGGLISSTPDWFQSMVIDGILGGVGGVLTFTPLMYFIYLLMAILEESGIMSRIAFVMDRAMKGLGLNGKAFISMIIGFGCTVPAITSTRTLDNEKQRKATAMMLPFISCGARLPVYALFCAAFFSKSFGLVVASLYILGIFIAVLVGLFLKVTGIYDGSDSNEAFTIELPPYRIPEGRILFKNVNNRVKGFLKRVTTLVMAITFIIWILSYFPTGEIKDSYLYKGTEVVKPVFYPTGFGDSSIAVAAIPTSIAAKEAVVSTIQQLAGTEEAEGDERAEETYLGYQVEELWSATKTSAISIFQSLNPLNVTGLFEADPDEAGSETINAASTMFVDSAGNVKEDASLRAYSYMVFILLVVPCGVAVATVRKEFGTKFMWQVIAVTLLVPYVISTLIFQIGSLII
ncbi:ferrous iron transport protein B [Erysipelotrichaceae bacterium OttesenSCG-928-M19]|nr:ferrous iron transport protein B [Erysipelotrichaceae bacterium OttesenSCG-928-M19]